MALKAKAWVMIPHNEKNEVVVEMKPLVLCEDCKWYKDNGATAECWLPCQEMSMPQKWFCASGEER